MHSLHHIYHSATTQSKSNHSLHHHHHCHHHTSSCHHNTQTAVPLLPQHRITAIHSSPSSPLAIALHSIHHIYHSATTPSNSNNSLHHHHHHHHPHRLPSSHFAECLSCTTLNGRRKGCPPCNTHFTHGNNVFVLLFSYVIVILFFVLHSAIS